MSEPTVAIKITKEQLDKFLSRISTQEIVLAESNAVEAFKKIGKCK